MTTTTLNSNTTITVGCSVRVSKGCRAFGINKGDTLKVTEVTPMGADYNHQVRVTFQVLSGSGLYGNRTFSLYARHQNRLADKFTRLNKGDPTLNIEITFKSAPVAQG